MYTTESFIIKAHNIHEDKYDYSKVEYQLATKKIIITCPKHGLFEQTPHKHLCGDGCPKCGHENIANLKKLPQNQFIKRAVDEHGDVYDYSEVFYKNMHTKVKIICPYHGDFLQIPQNHLRGSGCSKCGRIKGQIRGRDIDMEAYVYFIKVNYIHNRHALKFGFTTKPLNRRFKNEIANGYIIKEIDLYKTTLGEALLLEGKLLDKVKYNRCKWIASDFDGFTECFEMEQSLAKEIWDEIII